MLIPLSWLKEYVATKIPFADLAKRLCEVGLTIESWKEENGDIFFDPEITPNRGDWMSVTGIAREIAAATGCKLTLPKLITPPAKIKNPLPLDYKDDPKLCPKTTRVIIRGVKVKSSPDWLQKRIKQIGLRPINNLVDITNYVLWLYGNPLHVFDYDKIRGHKMTTSLSKGGEVFRSLDGINYKLPKGAIILKDVGRVIDLLPLKGGENTAVTPETKNVLLHSIVCDPVLTRRTSQALGLRSDSSAVSERGVDPNKTTTACLKALELILELAGGEVASPLTEVPDKPFPSWEVSISHEKIERILGINVEQKKVTNIFESLGFVIASNAKQSVYSVTIPTFRNDIHIEEDLIEEIGRIIGYNNFPKTLPLAPTPIVKVAYARNYDLEYEVKQVLKGAGYSEIYTYSLVSQVQLQKLGLNSTKVLNPISKDYEYLRPNLLGNLLEAIKLNLANFPEIKLFELGKQYGSEKEDYWLTAGVNGEKFFEVKGIIETILTQFDIDYAIKPDTTNNLMHPGRTAAIFAGSHPAIIGYLGEISPSLLAKFGLTCHVTSFTINYDLFGKLVKNSRKYQPISLYPPIIEDFTMTLPEGVLVGEIMEKIKLVSKLIANVQLISIHQRNFTFRLTYQDSNKNLTDKDVEPIRKRVSLVTPREH